MMSFEMLMFAQAGYMAKAMIEAGRERAEALQAAGEMVVGAYREFRPESQNQNIAQLAPSIGLAWAENAFSTIIPDHKLCASIACTSIPVECAKDVIMPWRCFRVYVPPGVLADSFAEILVCHGKDGNYYTVSANPACKHLSIGIEKSLAGFVTKFEWDEEKLESGFSVSDADILKRSDETLHRLVIGVCLELSSISIRPPGSWDGKPKRLGKEPKCWTYRLTRDVIVDVRAAIRAYISTGLRHPTVQSLVRGHRKRQPCGPNRSERRWIHVEPYWRGPEDAPIAVRAHVL